MSMSMTDGNGRPDHRVAVVDAPIDLWSDAALGVAARIGAWLRTLDASTRPQAQAITERMRASVMRPLSAALDTPSDIPAQIAASDEWESLDADLVRMALELARCANSDTAPAAVLEALAALMDLALTGPQVDATVDLAARRRAFAVAMAEASPRIVVRDDGPYIAVNCASFSDTLGLPMPAAAVTALCRCGTSAIKPICDGSHARIGFHPSKDPDWLVDRRRAYPSPASTILDNRSMCSRSELCSTRLASVFHQDERPFVTPSAGRLDEVVRAVLQCPSGALSLQLAGHDVRNYDGSGTRIAVTRDGPYHITGDLPLVGEDGQEIVRGDGAPDDRFALCRCGQTRNTPLCSGRHRDVHFTDPLPDREQLPSLFEWAGGMPMFQRLLRRFYETHVPADPLLAPLFGTMPPDHPERVAAWVAEVFGAPEVYSVPYGGFQRMMTRHLGGNFSEPQRARFVELMVKSADDVGLPADPEFRAAFVAYFEWGSRIAMETSRPGAKPPRNMQMPRWNWIRDAVPGSRPASFARHERRPDLVDPGSEGTVRFAVHIRPQFRKMDRLAMIYAFDLWNVQSVRERAEAILARLRDGTMPVDGAWPVEAIALFARWIETGMSD